jgi:hypothetical protein
MVWRLGGDKPHSTFPHAGLALRAIVDCYDSIRPAMGEVGYAKRPTNAREKVVAKNVIRDEAPQ